MSNSQQSETRTPTFARVLGPYLVIVTATALARASDVRTLLSEFSENSVWPWATGAFVLLGGLVVIALHQYWRGASAIIVSILGWLTALKGLLLLAIPQTYISFGQSAMDAGGWWQSGMVVTTVVGLYLTYVGWFPARNRPVPQAANSSPDLPRAA